MKIRWLARLLESPSEYAIRKLPQPVAKGIITDGEYQISRQLHADLNYGIACRRCGCVVFTAQRYAGRLTLACWSCPTFIAVIETREDSV